MDSLTRRRAAIPAALHRRTDQRSQPAGPARLPCPTVAARKIQRRSRTAAAPDSTPTAPPAASPPLVAPVAPMAAPRSRAETAPNPAALRLARTDSIHRWQASVPRPSPAARPAPEWAPRPSPAARHDSMPQVPMRRSPLARHPTVHRWSLPARAVTQLQRRGSSPAMRPRSAAIPPRTSLRHPALPVALPPAVRPIRRRILQHCGHLVAYRPRPASAPAVLPAVRPAASASNRAC